jgi:hypothetical protein
VDLVPVEALLLRLAPVPHLRVVHGEDPVFGGATAQARDVVLVQLEVLADQLSQQRSRLRHRHGGSQLRDALERAQRPLRVLRHPRQQPLSRRLRAPLTVRLLARLRVVERKVALKHGSRLGILAAHRIEQLPHA